jgi:hypothetical protein
MLSGVLKRNQVKGRMKDVPFAKNRIKGWDDQTKRFVILLKRVLFKILTELALILFLN